MKTFIHIFLLNVFIALFFVKSFGQGCSANIQAVKYCADQYAEFVINETNPNINYSWFSDAVGGSEYGYYNKRFASVFKVSDGSGPISYWYSKEIPEKLGQPVPAVAANGGVDISNPVDLQFDAKTGLLINSVVFVTRIYYLNPNQSYTLRLLISDGSNNYYSDPITVASSAFEQIGTSSDYKITIPVNIEIPAGTGYIMRIVDRNPTTMLYALYPVTTFSFPYDNDYITIYESSFSQSGITATPPYFDWDVTVICPRTEVISTQETNTANCCTPISDKIELSTKNTTVVTPFTADLLAVGSIYHNYKWYYEGNEIPGEEGVDNRYLTVDKLGRYEVRAVNNLNDVDKVSCYQSAVIELTEKKLFASDDIEICLGEKVKLSVKGAIGNITWSPNSFIDDINSEAPTVNPDQDMIYTVSALVPLGDGIDNGSFDDVMYNFTTDYQNVTVSGNMDNQKYAIGSKVSNALPTGVANWEQCEARQGDGSNIMWLNGAVNPNQRILEQTVPVESNLNYDFSMWVANIAYADNIVRNPANPGASPNIQVYINGIPVGGLYTHNGNVCQWKEHSFTWNSGNSSEAKIQIYETSMQNAGNDFAIDDVSFGKPGLQTDEVKVTVTNCLELTVSNDTTICIGDEAVLKANTNGIFMKWSPAEDFVDQLSSIQVVKPTETTTYSVETAYKLNNLIINGDFEQGLTQTLSDGTDYTPVPNAVNNVNVGAFTVGTNPLTANQYFRTIGDHTTGTGNMFIADGSSEISKEIVYSTVVTVEAGQLYAFSAWIANIHNQFENPAELSFYVENEKLGELDALENSDEWANFYYIWESTLDGSVTISIKNENTNPTGNDFALDDLEFTPLSPYTVSKDITVTVENCLPPVTDFETEVCEESNNSTSGINISLYTDSVRNFISEHAVEWYFDSGLTQPISNLTNQTVIGPNTIFYAKVYSASKNEFNTAQLTYIVNPLPEIVFPTMPVLCKSNDPYTIEGTLPSGGAYSGATIQNDSIFIPQNVGINQLTYEVTDSKGCNSIKVTSIEVSEPENMTFTQPDGICESVPQLDISSNVSPLTGSLGSGEFLGENISSDGIFTHNGNGEYSVYYKFTNIHGCVDSVSRTITVYQLPDADILPKSEGICTYAELQMDGNPFNGTEPYSHSWNAETGVLTNTSIQTPTFSSENAGDFTLVYTVTDDNGCIGQDTFILKVNDAPEITISPIDPLCEYDASVSVSVNVSPAGGTGSFSGSGITSTGVFDPSKAVISENSITYDYTDLTGCSNSATLEIVVNAKPNVSITSKDYACVNDETFAVEPNIGGGIFSGTGVTASGMFNPKEGIEGENTITYFYTDSETGCRDTAEKIITLHPLPEPDIVSETEFCSYDNVEILQLTPFHASRSELVGEGASLTSTGGKFDPSKVEEGEYDVTYSYTTEYGCTDSITKTFIVHHTDVPIPHDATGLITKDSKNIEKLSASLTETGAEIIWYNTSEIELSRDNPYNSGIETIGVTKFYVRQYLNGCYSDTVPAYLRIVDCPAPLPEVENSAICDGDDLIPIKAIHDTKYEIGWFKTSSTDGAVIGNAAEYLPSTVQLGENEYWVAHYDTERQCWGPSNRATLTVNENPDVSISNIFPNYCDYDDEIKAITSPEGGVLYLNGTETNLSTFDPMNLGEGDFTLHYVYINEETGCTDDDEESFTIHHTDPPTGNDITHYLNRSLDLLPDLQAVGADIRWYDDEATSKFLDDGNSYKTGITDTTPTTYFYYATQTLNGCESEPHKMRVHIVSCPTPAPEVEGYEICIYDPVQSLIATEAAIWPHEPKSGNGRMYWFSSEETENLDDTVTNMIFSGNVPFMPNIADKGEYTFFVAEWDLNCLSPKTPVTVEIIKTEKPVISVKDVCQFGNGNTISSDKYSTYWFPTADFNQTELARGYVYNFSTDISGDQTYFASYYKNGCFSEIVPAEIEVVKKPQAPIVLKDTAEICEGSANYHTLDIETYNNANVEWKTENDTKMSSSTVNLAMIPAGKVYEYFVRQDTTELGCWSEYASIWIDYIETPDKPRILNPQKYCLGDELQPVLLDPSYVSEIADFDVQWYDKSNNVIATGYMYMPNSVDVAQKVDFKVQTINRHCPSEVLDASLTVHEIPAVSINGPDSVCVLDGERLYNINNSKDEYTYFWHLSSETSTIKPVLVDQGNGGFNIVVEWVGAGVDTVYCETTHEGCTSFDTLVVYISDYPEIYFEHDVFLNSGKASFTNFTEKTPVIDGDIIVEQDNRNLWTFITSENYAMSYEQSMEDVEQNATFVQSGFTFGENYAKLYVVNEFGCAVDSTISIFVDMEATLFVPNTFAPEGPNEQVRMFRPKGTNIEKYEVYIYDQWGNQIWYSNKLLNGQPVEGWDGVYQGQELKADSYIWKIEARFKNGENWKGVKAKNGMYKKMGTVTIIR